MRRRRGVGAAVIALVGSAIATALLMGTPERPVDVRLVTPTPTTPETVTASLTTTMAAAVQPTTTVAVQVPVAPVATTTQSPSTPRATTTSRRKQLTDLLCEYMYRDDAGVEQCLPWVIDLRHTCQWLHDQGFDRIEVRGRDRHGLDPDENGIACD